MRDIKKHFYLCNMLYTIPICIFHGLKTVLSTLRLMLFYDVSNRAGKGPEV